MKKIPLLILAILLSTNVYASAPTRAYTYVSNTTIDPTQNNANENALYSYLQTGVDTYAASSITGAAISPSASIPYISLSLSNSIVNADISTTADIAGSKLGDLTTIPVSSGLIPPKNVFPAGMIVMWSGTIATIPSGWLLCDGTSGTPDLRDKFIVGAKQDSGGVAKTNITGSLTQSGGSTTIDITQIPAHTHDILTSTTVGGATTYVRVGVAAAQGVTQVSGSAGGGQPYTQPYYALAFIQKS